MNSPILWAAAGTGFTFLMTAFGASLVFFFRENINPTTQRVFLGFAAGVMTASSIRRAWVRFGSPSPTKRLAAPAAHRQTTEAIRALTVSFRE